MTARKLPMPGLRDTTGGEGGGDVAPAAAAIPGRAANMPPSDAVQQQVGSESGCGAPFAGEGLGEQHHARCSSKSGGRAGLASSIMQPLPLASRYVGATKNDTLRPASSALASSWIRRFLPTTGAELCKEATPCVPKAVGGGGGQGRHAAGLDGESGYHPASPLLLAAAPIEQSKEQQQAEGPMAKTPIVLDSCGETSGKDSRNGECISRGKAPLDREETESWMNEFAQNGAKESLRQVNNPPSHARDTYTGEGGSSSRLHQLDRNPRPFVYIRSVTQANCTTGARLRGFGPFQVFKSPLARDSGTVGGSGGPIPKGMDREARVEAEAAQPDGHRFASGKVFTDRTSTMASQTGTKSTTLSKSKPLEDKWYGRPPCEAEFGAAWGSSQPTDMEDVERDVGGGRSLRAQLDGAARETAAVVGGGVAKVSESSARLNPFGARNFKSSLEPGHQKFLDQESGVDRMKRVSSKLNGDGFVSIHPPTNFGRKEDGGQATESKFVSRPEEGAGAMPNAGFSTDIENRKMKGVVGFEFPCRRRTEAGPSQQQHSPESPLYGLLSLQADLFSGKVGHPLPYSPHSSFTGEENSGEDSRNSRGRDRAKSPIFPPPNIYDDVLATRAGKHAPWSSLFTAFKAVKYSEFENSSSSTRTLAPDVHPRIQDGSLPTNRSLEGHNVDGNRAEASGGGFGRNEAPSPASPETRSRFDNQSSHFSSSPWPDDEGLLPNAGSGRYNSQATGSGYHSQASRVATRSSGESKGIPTSTVRFPKGGETEGLDKAPRSRESSASEPDSSKNAGGRAEDEGQQMDIEENQAHVPSIRLKHSPTQATSGQKNDTSDSSPPSYPLAYNSSDSPVLPRGILDEHVSIAGKVRKIEVDSEMEGIRVPRLRKENRRYEGEFGPKRSKEGMNSLKYNSEVVYREPEEVRSLLRKDAHLQRAQPPVRDINRESKRSIDGLEPGLRHDRFRMSGEATVEGGNSGSSKRARHHLNQGSSDLGSQMAGSRMPSIWLTRWLVPSKGDAAKSPAGFARPKEDLRNGLDVEPPRSNGNTNSMNPSEVRSAQARMAEGVKGKEIEKRNEIKTRNVMKVTSSKRGLLGLPPHPLPSAAAIALVGTGTMRMGPYPQQRKGPATRWPPMHLHTAQAPEGDP